MTNNSEEGQGSQRAVVQMMMMYVGTASMRVLEPRFFAHGSGRVRYACGPVWANTVLLCCIPYGSRRHVWQGILQNASQIQQHWYHNSTRNNLHFYGDSNNTTLLDTWSRSDHCFQIPHMHTEHPCRSILLQQRQSDLTITVTRRRVCKAESTAASQRPGTSTWHRRVTKCRYRIQFLALSHPRQNNALAVYLGGARFESRLSSLRNFVVFFSPSWNTLGMHLDYNTNAPFKQHFFKCSILYCQPSIQLLHSGPCGGGNEPHHRITVLGT
jgi:hypothetical protein